MKAAIKSITTSVDEDGSRRKRRKSNSSDQEPEGAYRNNPNARQSHSRTIDDTEPSPSQLGSSTDTLDLGSKKTNSVLGANPPHKTLKANRREPSTSVRSGDAIATNALPSYHNSRRNRKSRKGNEKSNSVDAIEVLENANDEKSTPLYSSAAGTVPVEPLKGDGGQTLVSRDVIGNRPKDNSSLSSDSGSTHEVVQKSTEEDSRKFIRVGTDGKLVSPKRQKRAMPAPADEPPGSVVTLPGLPPTTYPPKRQTTPKKLMKIRSDGRLASPKSQANANESLKRRRGRPPKSIGSGSEGLVIINYGITEEVRISIGQKIAQIFSGSGIATRSEIASRLSSRPPEPLKATHPFFLGKLMRKPPAHSLGFERSGQNNNMVGEEDGHESSTSPAKKKSPRKSTANVNGGSCSSVASLGQNSIMFGSLRARRIPGSLEPIWPPEDMVHVRPDVESQLDTSSFLDENTMKLLKLSATNKLKHATAKVMEDEEVLYSYITKVKACRTKYSDIRDQHVRSELLRLPTRRIMRGSELRRLHCERNPLRSSEKGQACRADIDEIDELCGDSSLSEHTHPALNSLLQNITESRTAFDRFECETTDWAHKYAPKRAEDVLQPGHEAVILRNWLQSLTVNAVSQGTSITGAEKDSARTSKKLHANVTRKKRKRAEELKGFLVSSDEETNAMDELDDNTLLNNFELEGKENKRTVLRNRDVAAGTGKSTNAIVISGPNGCGKTAAAYAAARELGFEIFEINAGSRRSGRDILEKVGDMTRNHLVNQTQPNSKDQTNNPDEDTSPSNDVLRQEIELGRQGTMNVFVQCKKDKKKLSTKDMLARKDEAVEVKLTQKAQKQSVILLEEVDVLFEEDKQFWATTLELIMQSRRPVMMTCTDERLLPLDDLPLFGILRFRRPPAELATDYLLLLACNEGHSLSWDSVSALYKGRGNDLRASITELQFFCQMAIGDTKGGLEWMLTQSFGEAKDNSNPMRVVSDGTYQRGMGLVGHKSRLPGYEQTADDEIDIVSAVRSHWGIDLAVQKDFLEAGMTTLPRSTSVTDRSRSLGFVDIAYDALSAADTLQCPSFQTKLGSPLDTTTPAMSEKDRAGYTEGSTLVQANLLVDHSGVSDSIAAALRIWARRTLHEASSQHGKGPLDEQHVISVLPELVQSQLRPSSVTPQTLSTAFTPLSKPSKGSSASRGPLISSFDSPIGSVVEDIAPYVRSIVSYDLHLEEQRRQLGLAAQNGRDGKRARTTRASRAALEGGSKANTRRERWFPNNTDFQSILASGGKGWQEVVLRRSTADGAGTGDDVAASRRSSNASIDSRPSGA
ncbi:MAG: hypothetical protein L6R41_004017 [Letrouitia leprolyta]|nr:MAG: hypothetical protein L6R41_004017 [Letrouitia leprolyta]